MTFGMGNMHAASIGLSLGCLFLKPRNGASQTFRLKPETFPTTVGRLSDLSRKLF